MDRRAFIRNSGMGFLGTIIIPTDPFNNLGNALAAIPAQARYIWYDAEGLGRNIFGNFRKSFTLKSEPSVAKLQIFADTSYQLFVNGEFIQFGPVRFDPRYPVYDTHDLSKILKKGKNVIAVVVNYYGCKTYKSIENRAGLITWGEISAGNQKISLVSDKNSWKVIPAKEHTAYTPKMSFALNPYNIFEQDKEEQNWKLPDFDDAKWPKAVELANQVAWGIQEPRSIPFMSLKNIPVHEVIQAVPLNISEDIYSFTVPFPQFYNDEGIKNKRNIVAYQSWIFSEKDQVISAGCFFGENYINGKLIPRGAESKNKSIRLNQIWDLKKGWNELYGKVGAYMDAEDHYYAVPHGKGIYFSADKTENSDYYFLHSAMLTKEEWENLIAAKNASSSDYKNLISTWTKVSKENISQAPVRETSWDNYADGIEKITSENINGHIFPLTNYPDGFSLTLDLGQTFLVLPKLILEGVKGATIDVTYSEQLMPDKQHLFHNFNYQGGDRIICSQNTLDWVPTEVRGMRYLKITVRHPGADVNLKSVSVLNGSYPVEYKGSFNCSDGALNEVWLMGQRTQSTNMEDAYVDCVTRERGMYGRDTIIQYFNNLAAFGDQALMKRCLELYAQSNATNGIFRAVYPNTGTYTISDFGLNLIEGYKAYYDNTGDVDFIKKVWKPIQVNLKWFHDLADERADLLLDSDWDKKRKIKSEYGGFHGDLGIVKGHMINESISCTFSCNYLIALQDAVTLAQAIGNKTDLNDLNRRIQILKNSIPEKFWNAKLGRYSDNEKFSTHSIQANIMAIRAGLADGEKREKIITYLKVQLQSIFVNGYDPFGGVYFSPSYAFYIFDGLYKIGMSETAQNLMKQGWGWAAAQGMKTCPEYFTFDTSLCHAWSASPTYYISKNILGVNFPDAPDMSKVQIKVKASDIQFAEGNFPHPKGVIAVKWHMENDQRVFDYVKAPEGVKVEVIG